MRNAKCEMINPQSEIRNPQSSIPVHKPLVLLFWPGYNSLFFLSQACNFPLTKQLARIFHATSWSQIIPQEKTR
jgi:hypothetical protein